MSSYRWTLNGREVDSNVDNVELHKGNMTIKGASSLAEGQYQCIAKNRFGTIASNFLTLKRAVMGKAEKDVTTYTPVRGQHLVLPCNAPKCVPTCIPYQQEGQH